MITREASGLRTDRAPVPGRWAWRIDRACPIHGAIPAYRLDKALGRWAWGTQADDRVRPEHAALEGREYEADEGDPIEGQPGDAYGCRCFKIPLPDAYGGREGMTSKQFAAVERVSKRAKNEAVKRANREQAKLADAREAKKRGDSSARRGRLEVRLDRKPLEVLADGSWLVRGVAGAGDQILDYPEYGRTEWRPLAELVKAAPTLVHCPITIEHEVDTVDPDNYQAATHGHVTRAAVGPDKLLHFEALIRTRKALDAIEAGVDKLSLAYRLDPLAARTPAVTPDGTKVGGVQRDIVFDNLTLTDSPRAGEVAALRLDRITMKRHKLTATRADNTKWSGLLPVIMLAGLREDAADHGKRTDEEIAVGTLSVTMADGTQVDLTLPDGMIADVLAMIGAAPAGTSTPDADPADAALAAADAMDDAGDLVDELDLDSKTDRADAKRKPEAKPPAKRVDAVDVEAVIRAQLRTDAIRRDVEHRARPLFGERSLAHLDSAQIMAAGVRLATPAAAIRADSLAKVARDKRTDAEARGRALGQLEGLFERALEHRADEAKKVEEQRADSLGLDPATFARELFSPRVEKRTDADAKPTGREAMIARRTDRKGKGKARAA